MSDIDLILLSNGFWSHLLLSLEPRFALTAAAAFGIATHGSFAWSMLGALLASASNLAFGFILAFVLMRWRPSLRALSIGSGKFRRIASFALLFSPIPSLGSAFALLSGICRPFAWGLGWMVLGHVLYYGISSLSLTL